MINTLGPVASGTVVVVDVVMVVTTAAVVVVVAIVVEVIVLVVTAVLVVEEAGDVEGAEDEVVVDWLVGDGDTPQADATTSSRAIVEGPGKPISHLAVSLVVTSSEIVRRDAVTA